jgi:hypothetical protein
MPIYEFVSWSLLHRSAKRNAERRGNVWGNVTLRGGSDRRF